MERIVVAVEAGGDEPWLVDAAAGLARQTGAKACVVSVDGVDTAALSPVPRSETMDLARQSAESMAERLRSEGIDASAQARGGRVVPGILLYAEECEADLILVGGTRQGAVARRLLGSVALELVGRSRRPVLVVTPPGS